MVVMASLPDILEKYENISQNKYTYKDLSKLNPFLENDDGDILYHIALGSKSHDLPKMFGDVKVIVLGGTPRQMEKFAHFLMKYIGYELPAGTTLNNISRCSHRYSIFKVGPILSVSHGTGTPSVGIVLNELIKLVYHARIKDPIFIKIGSSGGFNLPEGSLVVTKKVFNEYLETSYEMFVLGKKMKFSTELDESLVNELESVSKSFDFDVTIGSTYCSDDFYEGSGRLDGAICEYTEEESVKFFKLLHDIGIVNTEMESTVFAATTRRAGIKSALVTVVIDNKMAEDRRSLIQPKIFDEWQIRLFSLVSAFIKRHLVMETSSRAREIKIHDNPQTVSLTETYFRTAFRAFGYGRPLRTTCAWSDSGRRATSPASNASETENWYDGLNTSNIPSNVTQNFPVIMNISKKSKDNESIFCPKCGAHVSAESNESLNKYSESSESVCWKCGVVLELAFPSLQLEDDHTKVRRSKQCSSDVRFAPTVRTQIMANESISMQSESSSKEVDKNYIATTHPMASPWISDSDSERVGRSKMGSEDTVPYFVTSEAMLETKQNPKPTESSATCSGFGRRYKTQTDLRANSSSVSCGSSYGDAADGTFEKSSTMSVRSSSISSFAEETDVSSNCGSSAQTTEYPLTKIPSTNGTRDLPAAKNCSKLVCPNSKVTPGTTEQHSATSENSPQSMSTPDGCPCLPSQPAKLEEKPTEIPMSTPDGCPCPPSQPAKLEEKPTEIMSGESKSTPSKPSDTNSSCPNSCRNIDSKTDKTSTSKNDVPPVAGGVVENETPHVCSTGLTERQIKDKLNDPDLQVRIRCPITECETEGNEQLLSPNFFKAHKRSSVLAESKDSEEPEPDQTRSSAGTDSEENHDEEEKSSASTAIPSACGIDGCKPKPLTGTAPASTTTPSTPPTTSDTNIKTESSVPDSGSKGLSQPVQESGSNVVKEEGSLASTLPREDSICEPCLRKIDNKTSTMKEGSLASTLPREDSICEPCSRKIDDKTSTKTEESRKSEETPDLHAKCQRRSGLYCIKPSVTNQLDGQKTFPSQVSTTDPTKSASSNLKTNTQTSSDEYHCKGRSVSDVDAPGACQRSNSDVAQKSSVKTSIAENPADSSSSNCAPCLKSAAHESTSESSKQENLKSVDSNLTTRLPSTKSAVLESTSKTSDQGKLKKSGDSSSSDSTSCTRSAAHESTSKSSDGGTVKKSVGSSSCCPHSMNGTAHESTSKTEDRSTLKKSVDSSSSTRMPPTKSAVQESTTKTSDQGTLKKSVGSSSCRCPLFMNDTAHESTSKTSNKDPLKRSAGSNSSGCLPCASGAAQDPTSKISDQNTLKKSVGLSCMPCIDEVLQKFTSKISHQETSKTSVGSTCKASKKNTPTPKTSDQNLLKKSMSSSSSGYLPRVPGANQELTFKTSHQRALKKLVNETTKEPAQGSKVDDKSTTSKKTSSHRNSSSSAYAEKLVSTNLGGKLQRESGSKSRSKKSSNSVSRRKTKPNPEITPPNAYLDFENDDVFIEEKGPCLDTEMDKEIQKSERIKCLSCTLHNDKTMSNGSSLMSYLENRDYMNERREQEVIMSATSARDSMSSLPCCNYHADLREKSKNLITGSTVQIEDLEPCCSGYELLGEYFSRESFMSLHRQTIILSTPTTSCDSPKSLIYGISVTPKYESEDIFSPSPCSLCKKFQENIKRCTNDILIDSQPEIIKCRHKLKRLKDECHGYD